MSGVVGGAGTDLPRSSLRSSDSRVSILTGERERERRRSGSGERWAVAAQRSSACTGSDVGAADQASAEKGVRGRRARRGAAETARRRTFSGHEGGVRAA